MTGEELLFWPVAVVMVLAASALLFARKAVHVAMSMVAVMVGLAILYFSLGAPFLGVVQIVVYTGAVMMLFLFVLMLVGVDSRESIKETVRGQRLLTIVTAGALAFLLFSTLRDVTIDPSRGFSDEDVERNVQDLANVLFSEWVVVMEILAALLITAAVGALVLTHMPRLAPARGQRIQSAERLRAGLDPVNKPMPGVYARHNALDIPALDPDGKPLDDSVSRVLEARQQTTDGSEWRAIAADDEEASS